MLQKYLDAPLSSAPEWMNELQKRKNVDDANIEVNDYKFEFYWKEHLFSRDVKKHSFHILFYTKIVLGEGSVDAEFVAMDKTTGKLYLIAYNENHTESSTYSIDFSESLDELHFNQILDEFDTKIPGIKEKYGAFYKNNWHNYIEMKSKQVLSSLLLSISFDVGEYRHFYMLDNEALSKSTAYAFSCPNDFYVEWKTVNNHPLDEVINKDELIAHSAFFFKKKLNIFNARKIRQKFTQLRDAAIKSKEGDSNSGHFLLIKYGLLNGEKYGTPNQALIKTANEIFELIRK